MKKEEKNSKKNYEETRGDKFVRFFELAMNMTVKSYTFRMIQEEFGDLSTRQTYRVIDKLKRVFGDSLIERGYGTEQKSWRIGPTNSLEKMVSFSEQQISLIEKCKKNIKNKKLSTEAIDAIISKMVCLSAKKRFLTDNDIEYLTETEDYVRRPLPHHKIKPEIAQTIREAINMCHVIECNYFKDEGDIIRNLEPYAIVHGTNTLLVAKEQDTTGKLIFKNYRLDRFNHVKDTNIEFEKEEDFSLKEYMKDCFGVWHEKEIMDVELKFSKEVADEVKKYHFHSSQKLTNNSDGTVNINMHVCGKKELCNHIVTWGKNVQIIKPQSLIDEYETFLKEALSTIKK